MHEDFQSVTGKDQNVPLNTLGSSMPKSRMSGEQAMQSNLSHKESAASIQRLKRPTSNDSRHSKASLHKAKVDVSPAKLSNIISGERLDTHIVNTGGQSSRRELDSEREREEMLRPMKQLYWNNELLPAINLAYNNSKLPGYVYDHAELYKMQ